MRARLFAAFTVVATMTSLASAEEYPSHPIQLIVPFAAGGGADVVARIIAEQVSTTIGQPIIVENKAGAAAIVGTEYAAKARPDGYTLLLGQSGPISINPAVYESLQYDPVKDFAPITLTTAYPYILVVNAKEPEKTLKELVAKIKASPDTFNYGTAGIGGANHLVTEMLSEAAGLKMTQVPYRGTAPAVTDLLGGRLTLVFSDPISALAQIQSGALRAIAVSSKERSSVAPDVPTVAESGYPGFDAIGWHGILAPANTPPAVIRKLHDQIVSALNDPHTKSLLAGQATQTIGSTPEEFAAFIHDDIAKWAAIAHHANITVK
jgi:tripartite-type tricarboxylate transporter receptor subunit TctC